MMSLRQLWRMTGRKFGGKSWGSCCRWVGGAVLLGVTWELSPVLLALGHVARVEIDTARQVAMRGHGPESYFTAGMWRADVGTLKAMVHYLLEAEPRFEAPPRAIGATTGLPVARFQLTTQTNAPAPI
jgi:hypothetical protein